MTEAELVLPHPLKHQAEVLLSPARFKLWRAGRRTGKSRGSLIAAFCGHGPLVPGSDRRRQWRGALTGGDIVWFSPDYKQSQAIWREEIRPRLTGLAGVKVSESERRVEILGHGSLQLLSAENIDAARGRKLDGAILDEAAHFDLEYAWGAVVRPALVDRRGWAIFASTPNAGHDGNSLKRLPSYFNRLCVDEDVRRLGPEWAQFHQATTANVKIQPEEIDGLVAQYGTDSPVYQQEILALLIAGSALGLTELNREKHLIPPFPIPDHWTVFGAYDPGFNHPFAFGIFAADEDGNVYLVESVHGRRMHVPEQADRLLTTLRQVGLARETDDLRLAARRFSHVVGGHDIKAANRALGVQVPTLQEQWAEYGVYIDLADISRVAGVQNMRRYLKWRFPNGEERTPRFRIFETEKNLITYRCLETRVSDPREIEDMLKTDADDRGEGGDDPYDMVRYGLASRPLAAVQPPEPVKVLPSGQDPWAVIPEHEQYLNGFIRDYGAGF